MDTTTAVVFIVGLALVTGLIAFALHRKRYVKASGRFKSGEFYIEANDREK